MTRQVALSNDAYEQLRREKRPTESFSDVILRVMKQARAAEKDPMGWLVRPHQSLWTMEERLRVVEEGRQVDRERADPWDEERRRQARQHGKA